MKVEMSEQTFNVIGNLLVNESIQVSANVVQQFATAQQEWQKAVKLHNEGQAKSGEAQD